MDLLDGPEAEHPRDMPRGKGRSYGKASRWARTRLECPFHLK
jgi:hypothetical protein